METLDPFTGEIITIGGRRYRRVEAQLLDWLEHQCGGAPNPNRPRVYCGTAAVIPPEYTRRGTEYECMRKGVGAGICKVYSKFGGRSAQR